MSERDPLGAARGNLSLEAFDALPEAHKGVALRHLLLSDGASAALNRRNLSDPEAMAAYAKAMAPILAAGDRYFAELAWQEKANQTYFNRPRPEFEQLAAARRTAAATERAALAAERAADAADLATATRRRVVVRTVGPSKPATPPTEVAPPPRPKRTPPASDQALVAFAGALKLDGDVCAHLGIAGRTLRHLLAVSRRAGVVVPVAGGGRARRWTGGPDAWAAWYQEITHWQASSPSRGVGSPSAGAKVTLPDNKPAKPAATLNGSSARLKPPSRPGSAGIRANDSGRPRLLTFPTGPTGS